MPTPAQLTKDLELENLEKIELKDDSVSDCEKSLPPVNKHTNNFVDDDSQENSSSQSGSVTFLNEKDLLKEDKKKQLTQT